MPTGGTVLVAVSGGPDSLVLLDLTVRVGTGLRLTPIVVHLDHGWRDDSADDARFVAAEAERRGLAAIVERAESLPPTEAAGRDARHGLFARAQRTCGAVGVLLGHTADDLAESVLLHLLRGSGLEGLVGMRVDTTLDVHGAGLRLLRPLLGLRRAEVHAYCERRGLTPRLDRSNDDPRFARNRLRQEVLPTLERIHPGAIVALARLAEVTAADVDLVAAAVDAAWPTLAEREGDQVRVDRVHFRRQHPSVQRGVLRRIAREFAGAAPDLSVERLEAARATLLGGRGSAVLEWPGPIRLRIAGRLATFEREEPP